MHWKAHWSLIHATLEDPGRRVEDALAKSVIFLEDAVRPGEIAHDWLKGCGRKDAAIPGQPGHEQTGPPNAENAGGESRRASHQEESGEDGAYVMLEAT
eukprot:5384010-Prorocentrum_lima.AAC.1